MNAKNKIGVTKKERKKFSDSVNAVLKNVYGMRSKSKFQASSKVQPGPPQTSKMESFATIVNG